MTKFHILFSILLGQFIPFIPTTSGQIQNVAENFFVICREPDGFELHEDCTKFYLCSNGIPNLIECPSGLYFNPDKNECDEPGEVPACEGGTRETVIPTAVTSNPTTESTSTTLELIPTTNESPPTTGESSSTTQESTPTTETSGSTTEESGPTTEHSPPTTEESIPTTNESPPTTNESIPTTEGSTLTTEASRPTTEESVPTTQDSSATTVESTNESTPTTIESWPTTQGSTPTTQDLTPTTRWSTPTTEEYQTTPYPGICPPEGIHRIPHPGNCSLYYFCISGRPTLESCAVGLLFDPVSRDCKRASEVECLDQPSTTEQPSICPEEGRHFLPYPGNCSLYIVCDEGQPYYEECSPGYLFDPILGKCNFPDLVDCEYAVPTCPKDGIVYLPVQGSCLKYVFCFNGVPNYLACDEGLVFDPNRSLCVLESEFDCPYLRKLLRFLSKYSHSRLNIYATQ